MLLTNQNIQIPDHLRFRKISPEDVNIIIGENGSGKSFLLSQLADNYLMSNYSNVIVIANSIHDKFRPRTSNRFHALKNSSGRKLAKDILKKSLINMSKDSSKRINYATRVLNYIGFDARIGFKLEIIGRGNSDLIFNIEDSFKSKIFNLDIPKNHKELLYSITSKYLNYSDDNSIKWFKTFENNFIEFDQHSFLEFFKWEKLLVKNKIIRPIEVFLSKEGQAIPLLSASSGELSLITTMLYITSIIDENTVILIDEPENSLHPKWQSEYVKNLVDVVYLYQPRIVIATHSPLIVGGAELSVNNLKIFKATNFQFTLQEKILKNIEEIYYDFFDIITPENRTLSNTIVDELNKLSKKEISLVEFEYFLSFIHNNITDIRQKKMLHGISDIAKKIVLQRNN